MGWKSSGPWWGLMSLSLLEVNELNVAFDTPDGSVRAVRDLSFSVERGRTLGIVGESGSGKSVSVQTILGLTRGASTRITGEALFEGDDLLKMRPAKLRALRGARIGMIFQDPLSSLHPYYKIGWQIVELLRAHDRSVDRHSARRRAIELLDLVGIPEPSRRVDDYPHQFSGGMRQRVMIAMAMALNPSLLIADEPTTALDVTVQAQILAVLEDLQRNFAMAIILITHDLGVIAEVADEVVVMYAGSTMERASRRELFYDARHPYTIGLLQSLPSYDELAASGQQPNGLTASGATEQESSSQNSELGAEMTTGSEVAVDPFARRRLYSIPGQPPSLLGLAGGCPFTPRCIFRMERCPRERPPLFTVAREPIVAIAGRSARLHAEPDVGQRDPTGDGHEASPHLSACWLEALDEAVTPAGEPRAQDSGPTSPIGETADRTAETK
ncbi:MAG: ABC transporter ATP-binding protein [Acidimicrobiales bacterium]